MASSRKRKCTVGIGSDIDCAFTIYTQHEALALRYARVRPRNSAVLAHRDASTGRAGIQPLTALHDREDNADFRRADACERIATVGAFINAIAIGSCVHNVAIIRVDEQPPHGGVDIDGSPSATAI